LSAPASLLGQTWSTPNSEVDFKGGVALLQYFPKEKVSMAGCFNRKIEFRNKFNTTAIQTLNAGEMSHLAIQEARVQPSHPTVMHHSAVLAVLDQVGVDKDEKDQLVAVAKQVYEDRSKSLVSEIEEWGEGEEGPSRSIASIPTSSKKSIDPKEASFTMKLLKDRIYGTPEEQAKFVPKAVRASRSPASVIDTEKEKQKDGFKKEAKRVEKEIERLDPDTVE
jgi:hypothetical protein